MDRLKAYREKRDFRRTPEPAGEETKAPAPAAGGLFVVQKHAARNLHYDLRLEQEGVLRSWAVPKGFDLRPGEKHLAVAVEDHPLEYGDFEGVIPEQEYGAGTVMLWDRGQWAPRDGGVADDRLDFELTGHKLQGGWTLVRMKGKAGDGGKNWLLIKHHDGRGDDLDGTVTGEDVSVATGRSLDQIARDRDRVWTRAAKTGGDPPDAAAIRGAREADLPSAPRPLLATLAQEVPDGKNWLYELKLDGYRILARVADADVQLITRNGKDWTDRFPGVARALREASLGRAVFDGEVVSLAADGSTNFRRLQEALSTGKTSGLVYYVFDLLHLDGQDLAAAALTDRKEALQRLFAGAGFTTTTRVRYMDHLRGRGQAMLDQVCRMGLEGIIAKRADGRYRAGRGKAWVKVKCARHEEFVVGGFTEAGGTRSGFGALLLGAHGPDGLVYAGKVGTGFSERQLTDLHRTLQRLERRTKPFAGEVPEARGVHWVRPALVVEVEFTEWTRDGRLRHPVFRGVRDDRDPNEITLPKEQGGMSGSQTGPRRKPGSSRKPANREEAVVAGVRLTNPDRVLYPEQGVSKLDLARYYEEIQDWILPQLADRPLSLVRCPQGHETQCFYQKHPGDSIRADVPRIQIREKEGTADYLYVQSVSDIVALVQAGVLEIHPWGSRVTDVEKPDCLVFDLDPAPDVAWRDILEAAAGLRERLEALGLTPFTRTTGGKGLHLVVPLKPQQDWDVAKAFARAVCERHAADAPRRFTTNMSKAGRKGRIFLDYLRNGRGSTAIASYSTRARAGAPVAVPVRWDELNPGLHSDRYHIGNLRRRLTALKADPWVGFDEARRPLTREIRRAVGAE